MVEGSGHFSLNIQQITHGPRNHFFGYIGHAKTIPWSHNGRYIVAMRTDFQDHMPGPGESADIILIDTQNGFTIEKVDETTGWNPQQGTMFYWDPDPNRSRFFFNDRDPETDKVFTVLYDVAVGSRVREYRYEGTPFGNSGVAQNGGWFCGLNYARMARLRRVTGYVGTWDWTENVSHPEDDGIFRTNIETGEREVIVSFARMAEALAPTQNGDEVNPLFVNHTLWNRADDRIYFYARGGWDGNPGVRINQPFTVDPDGGNLTIQPGFVGGHPEWEHGDTHCMIGHHEGKLVIYDTNAQQLVGTIADPSIVRDPSGDTALSPDGGWIVSGYKHEGLNEWAVYRRSDGAWARTPGYDQSPYIEGDLRSDPAPLWNRDGTQILFPSIVTDGSRQLHLITIVG